MLSDRFKELEPVNYAGRTVKHWYTSFQKNIVCFPLHWHERMEILDIIEGSLTMQVDNEIFNAYTGDTVIISPGRLHTAKTGENGVVYGLYAFDLAPLKNANIRTLEHIDNLLEMKKRFAAIVNDEIIRECCNNIALLHKNWLPDNALSEVGIIYKLIGHLYQHYLIDYPLQISSNKRFSEVTDYITAHFLDPISTLDISKHFNYTESYFCRKFKNITGISPMTYINILRIEKSCQLLEQTELPIQEISLRCGFKDQNYYTRCFRKRYQMSPSEYLRSFKSNYKIR